MGGTPRKQLFFRTPSGVAFSNADGGELIIGITDKKKCEALNDRWEGVSDIEHLNGHLQALFEVQPALDIKYELLKRKTIDGYALRILVEKGAHVCATADGSVYQRQGAQSLLIKDPDRIQQLSFAKGARSFEDTLLPDLPTEQVVEALELRSFLNDYSPRTDPLEFAINQNLLDYRTWQPRTVDALLFHSAPSAMSGIEVWSTNGLKRLEYPPEAIWETIVNAVVHRDYSISDDVQILVFDN